VFQSLLRCTSEKYRKQYAAVSRELLCTPLLLNDEFDVEDAADSFKDGVIEGAQHALDLGFSRTVRVEVAGVEEVGLPRAKRLELLGAKIMLPRKGRRIMHRVGKPVEQRMIHDQGLMHDFAILESERARQPDTLSINGARCDIGYQGGQGFEIRQKRPDLLRIGLKDGVGRTDGPRHSLIGSRGCAHRQ
jgi:hypothetical protein